MARPPLSSKACSGSTSNIITFASPAAAMKAPSSERRKALANQFGQNLGDVLQLARYVMDHLNAFWGCIFDTFHQP